ncbi:hypothetical protein GCM10020331_023940 [Ectobacillus funiculus]
MKAAVGFGFLGGFTHKKPKKFVVFFTRIFSFFHMNISVTMELDSKKKVSPIVTRLEE